MTEGSTLSEPCGCIAIVDAKLNERNTALVQPLVLGLAGPTRLLVETYQIETGRGKKKRVSMFASYCPFCGVKYPERSDA